MRVAVVGAGPCGLVATKTLSQRGVEVACFEASPYVGGHWKIDNPSGRSAAYESLTTNTNKVMSRLSDFAMPADWPDLPTHDHLYRWWCSYVEHFGLRQSLKLDCEVTRVTPCQTGGWHVHSRNSTNERDQPAIQRFDVVIAASGNYWHPKLPGEAQSFAGDSIHALVYRSPTRPLDMTDKTVLVVGSGNTGCEIALELSRAPTKQVLLSARSGNWILPKYIDGPNGREHIATNAPLNHPCDTVPALLRWLPERAREGLFTRIARVAMRKQFGEHADRLTRAGLPPPPDNPLSKRPAVADDLAQALETGQLSARGGIKSITQKRVEFSLGASAEVDVIVFATGYHLSYPYLDSSILDTSTDDISLYRGLMHPQHHNLFVIGVSRPTGGFWPVAEAQAQFIAELLTRQYTLPPQAVIDRDTAPVLKRDSFNPALYGLALRQEVARGRRR